ncbi:diguanylate cyclase [Candidatus Woesearchaeota archaeon]|nr:diguanylate cyclase [Candidatus Woesearchaeota archaeon]
MDTKYNWRTQWLEPEALACLDAIKTTSSDVTSQRVAESIRKKVESGEPAFCTGLEATIEKTINQYNPQTNFYEIKSSIYSILQSSVTTFSDRINQTQKKKTVETTQPLATQNEFDRLSGLTRYELFLEEVERIKKQHENLTLVDIIIDAKNFKTINDTYGHLEGDEVIKELGNLVKYTLNNGNERGTKRDPRRKEGQITQNRRGTERRQENGYRKVGKFSEIRIAAARRGSAADEIEIVAMSEDSKLYYIASRFLEELIANRNVVDNSGNALFPRLSKLGYDMDFKAGISFGKKLEDAQHRADQALNLAGLVGEVTGNTFVYDPEGIDTNIKQKYLLAKTHSDRIATTMFTNLSEKYIELFEYLKTSLAKIASEPVMENVGGRTSRRPRGSYNLGSTEFKVYLKDILDTVIEDKKESIFYNHRILNYLTSEVLKEIRTDREVRNGFMESLVQAYFELEKDEFNNPIIKKDNPITKRPTYAKPVFKQLYKKLESYRKTTSSATTKTISDRVDILTGKDKRSYI